MNNGTPSYESSNSLLAIDLSSGWSNATVKIQSIPKPDGVPNLSSPSLWYHDSARVLYLGYTGTSPSFSNDDLPPLPPLSLWTFEPDGTGSGTWNEVYDANASVWPSKTRPDEAYMAYGNGKAYVLGGKSDDQASIGGTILPGLVSFDMETQTFTNDTTATGPSGRPAHGGGMEFVPVFGPGGLLIAMGGDDGDLATIDFGFVTVYDCAKGLWYNQSTTGNKPAPRRQFCTAGLASSNETYEIFVYAGVTGPLGTVAVQYDTINILTLPAFHWLSVPYSPQNPRIKHTCNAVGGSQIVIVGGSDANPKDVGGDLELITKSEFESKDPFQQGLAIFDMHELQFINGYTAGGAAEYELSDAVKQIYTNSNQSLAGNIQPDLAALLKDTHFPNSQPTPNVVNSKTKNKSSNRTSEEIIASGVVGGILLIASIVGVAAFFYLRRRRSKGNSDTSGGKRHHGPEPIEKDDQTNRPVEMCGSGMAEMSNIQVPAEADQENGLQEALGNLRWLSELYGDPHSLGELQGDYRPASNGSDRER